MILEAMIFVALLAWALEITIAILIPAEIVIFILLLALKLRG